MWVLTYVSFLVFICGIAAKAVRYCRQPVHLRWDMIIPSQRDGNAPHSLYERQDWWMRPPAKKRAEELRYMAAEMLLFRGYYRTNRLLWCLTYPLHLGVYLGALWLVLLAAGAVVPVRSLQTASVVCGVSAFFLGAAGAIGLFAARIIRTDLRSYSAFADYFNLFFLSVLFLAGFAAWYGDPDFAFIKDYISGLLLIGPYRPLPLMPAVFWAVLCCFVLYLPFTSMMHFVGKYFLFHAVQWDDEPNTKGGRLEKELDRRLTGKPGWSGAHIGQGAAWRDRMMNGSSEDTRSDGPKP
jgi:nitrate reductase gamma subunit